MRKMTVLLFCLSSLIATGADATLIFNRPAADPFTAGGLFSDLSRPREATTSFELPAACNLLEIGWQGYYFDPETPGATAAFVIQLFDDVAGTPSDTAFYSVEVSADVVTLAGVVVEYAYAAVLPEALPLPGGVPFWISIAENDTATAATFAWRKSSETGTSYSRVDSASNWEAQSGSIGLALGGSVVPEPGTIALLGFGVIGLAGGRAGTRRRSDR